MRSNRRGFLTSALAGSASALLAARAAAQTTSAPAPSPTPSPKPPSALAQATADEMRRFDPKLTDAEVANIAGQIDGNWKSGERLNPKGKRLKNSDEPVTAIHPAS